jgi:hypothetical protein
MDFFFLQPPAQQTNFKNIKAMKKFRLTTKNQKIEDSIVQNATINCKFPQTLLQFEWEKMVMIHTHAGLKKSRALTGTIFWSSTLLKKQ